MSKTDFPSISEQFLKALEDKFPDRMPDHNDSHVEIAFQAGQVSVVRNLRAIFDQQNKNPLKAH